MKLSEISSLSPQEDSQGYANIDEPMYRKLLGIVQSTMDWEGSAPGEDRKIQPKHMTIFLMEVQGFSRRDIQSVTGFDRFTQRQILKSPQGQALLTELYKEQALQSTIVMNKIRGTALEAVDTIQDVMNHADKPEVRLRAATTLLDRAGYSPVQKGEYTHTNVTKLEIVEEASDLLDMIEQESSEVFGDFKIVEVFDDPG